MQKYAIEMGGVSRYFFTCVGVRGPFDSPDLSYFEFFGVRGVLAGSQHHNTMVS